MKQSVKSSLETEYKQVKKILSNSNERDKCYNLDGFDGKVTLEELYKLKSFIYDIEELDNCIGGSSYEGNGVNFNFTWMNKPFLLRIELDDFHYEIWKQNGMIK
jgi:hypothetical protein